MGITLLARISPLEAVPAFRVSFADEPMSVAFELPVSHLPVCLAFILSAERANGFVLGDLGSSTGGGTKKRRRCRTIPKAQLALMKCPSISAH
jgi:hypothetical protein